MSIRYRKWRSILDLDLLTDQSEFIETARHASPWSSLAREGLSADSFSFSAF